MCLVSVLYVRVRTCVISWCVVTFSGGVKFVTLESSARVCPLILSLLRDSSDGESAVRFGFLLNELGCGRWGLVFPYWFPFFSRSCTVYYTTVPVKGTTCVLEVRIDVVMWIVSAINGTKSTYSYSYDAVVVFRIRKRSMLNPIFCRLWQQQQSVLSQ